MGPTATVKPSANEPRSFLAHASRTRTRTRPRSPRSDQRAVTAEGFAPRLNKGYCNARSIATDGLGLVMHVEREPGKARVARLVLEITLPAGFPDTHREAVVRAADLCAVRKHILNPPAFEMWAV
jgi:hypothetical protein